MQLIHTYIYAVVACAIPYTLVVIDFAMTPLPDQLGTYGRAKGPYDKWFWLVSPRPCVSKPGPPWCVRSLAC